MPYKNTQIGIFGMKINHLAALLDIRIEKASMNFRHILVSKKNLEKVFRLTEINFRRGIICHLSKDLHLHTNPIL
jgi:hypothetical protein